MLKCPRTESTFNPLSSLLPSPLSLSWNKNNLSITHIIAEKLRKTDQSSVFCHFFFISHAYLLLREKKSLTFKKNDFCLFGSMHIIIVLHPNASFVWVIFTKSKLLCLNKIFHKIAHNKGGNVYLLFCSPCIHNTLPNVIEYYCAIHFWGRGHLGPLLRRTFRVRRFIQESIFQLLKQTVDPPNRFQKEANTTQFVF